MRFLKQVDSVDLLSRAPTGPGDRICASSRLRGQSCDQKAEEDAWSFFEAMATRLDAVEKNNQADGRSYPKLPHVTGLPTMQALKRGLAILERRSGCHNMKPVTNPEGYNQKGRSTRCADCGVSKEERHRWYISSAIDRPGGTRCKTCIGTKKKTQREQKKREKAQLG